MANRGTPIAASLAATLVISCTGNIGDAPGGVVPQPVTIEDPFTGTVDPDRPESCGPVGSQAGTAPILRIAKRQYLNAVRDLFAGRLEPSDDFPAPLPWDGYSTNPAANQVSLLDAERIMVAAEAVGRQAAEILPEFLPCHDSADRKCVETLITDLGGRAFRRAPTADETNLLLELYDEVALDTPFPAAVGMVVTAILQMPQFLYVLEYGTDMPGMPEVFALTDQELAVRLSLTFWDTLPDAELRSLAEQGKLRDPDMLEAQARRLLASDRALPVMKQFHREWMRLEPLEPGAKDPTEFPEYNPELARSMEEEFDKFIEHVLFGQGASLSALLTSKETQVNSTMAAFYGLPEGTSSGPEDWVPVVLDDGMRVGVLSRPAVLATHAHQIQTSPIYRGKLVRTRMLCDVIPPPPADAMANTPDFPAGATQREKSDILVRQESCGGCHALMNPIGLGLEGFDALGRVRTHEADGSPVDTSGTVVNGRGLTSFDGVVDLSEQLEGFDLVHECMVRQWFQYSMGRRDARQDSCTITQAKNRFVREGLDIRELLVALTRTDGFRFRRIPTNEQGVP